MFNATVNNSSVMSWRSVLFVEETRVPGEGQESKRSCINVRRIELLVSMTFLLIFCTVSAVSYFYGMPILHIIIEYAYEIYSHLMNILLLLLSSKRLTPDY